MSRNVRWTTEGEPWVLSIFPGIDPNNFEITSDDNKLYNCIAWAVEDRIRWWWPMRRRYWPLRGEHYAATIPAFIAALATKRYTACNFDDSVDPDYQKIVIYATDSGRPTHAARQLRNGLWTSKIGEGWDISHHNLSDIEGATYGKAVQMLRRPLLKPKAAKAKVTQSQKKKSGKKNKSRRR